ncbi:MAG: TonB-dependent receptor domain-containing protein, partial [Steroidobacteraceae bacterium]
WRLGHWLLDAEYRTENENIDGIVEATANADLDDDPLTLYNNDTSIVTGRWLPSTYDHTLGAWSAGANYEINSNMSVYGRINEGVHFPSFDDVRVGTPDSQQIENYQVGFKAQTHSLYASVDIFHRLFFGVPFQAFLGNGSQVTATYGARSWGADFQADWFPLRHLSLGLTGDWQHSVYTHFSSFAGLGTGAYDNDGNILQRQPRLQLRLTPEYDVPMSWGKLQVFATVSYVDLRYSDPENTQILPAYRTLDAGILGDFGEHLEVRLQGTNLSDALGLTEGNSRSLSAGISTGFEMARPIFGREVQAQLKYYF